MSRCRNVAVIALLRPLLSRCFFAPSKWGKDSFSKELSASWERRAGCSAAFEAELLGEHLVSPPREAGGPFGDRAADLGSRILLDEMAAADRDLRLVMPAAAEFARRPGQDRTRLGVDKQLRHLVLRHPFGIGGDQGDDICRLAVDRDLARPGEGRPALFAGWERPPVFGHLGRLQLAQDRGG